MRSRLRILILSKSDVNIEYLRRALASYEVVVCQSRNELLRNIADADIVVAQNKGFAFGSIDRHVLEQGKSLRLIQHFGVQWDITDIEEAAHLGIPVAVVEGGNTRSVAEHAIYLLLSLAKRTRAAQQSVAGGTMGQLRAAEVKNKVLVVIGFGRIGSCVAEIARGFAMRVIGVDKVASSFTEAALGLDGLFAATDLSQALGWGDFVLLTLPLNRETFNLIGSDEFEAMKEGACLINVSRAPHVDRNALARALEGGGIHGFAADVWWEEPANPHDPLLQDERVFFTPHIAGQTKEVLERTVDAIRQNVDRVSTGLPPSGVVNHNAGDV